jgi:hypothetical protein
VAEAVRSIGVSEVTYYRWRLAGVREVLQARGPAAAA